MTGVPIRISNWGEPLKMVDASELGSNGVTEAILKMSAEELRPLLVTALMYLDNYDDRSPEDLAKLHRETFQAFADIYNSILSAQ